MNPKKNKLWIEMKNMVKKHYQKINFINVYLMKNLLKIMMN